MDLKPNYRIILNDGGSSLDIAPVNGGFAVVASDIVVDSPLYEKLRPTLRRLRDQELRSTVVLTSPFMVAMSAMLGLFGNPWVRGRIDDAAFTALMSKLRIVPVCYYKYIPIENSPFQLALQEDDGRLTVVFDGMVDKVEKI